MSYNALILEASEAHLGLAEWPGSKHNPDIVRMFRASGHEWVQDDETPWCAAFIGALLAEVGLQGTGQLNARSYMKWGQRVEMADARPGDVVVFSRGDPNGWQGHVAILIRFEGSRVIVRGGNQGNKVSDAPYPISRLLGIRRADGGRSASNRPVLRIGSRGPDVRTLQVTLRDLGYHLGKVDDVFGPLTERAVLAFQQANRLTADGIVGRRTWAKLEGEPMAPTLRAVSTKDLRERGSRQIKTADGLQVSQFLQAGTAVGGGGLSAASIAKLQADLTTTKAEIEEFSDTDGVEGGLADILPIAILALTGVIAGLAVWSFVKSGKMKIFRTEDAQTGAHIGR